MAVIDGGTYTDDPIAVSVGSRVLNSGSVYTNPATEVFAIGRRSLFSIGAPVTGQLWPRGNGTALAEQQFITQ